MPTIVLISGTLIFKGLWALPWANNLVWQDIPAFQAFVFTFLFAVTMILGIAIGLRRSPLVATSIFTACVFLAAGSVWPAMVAGLFACSATMLGRTISHVLGGRHDSPLINFALGAGIFGTVVGLLAHFPVNYPGVYWVGLLLPMIIQRQHLAMVVSQLTPPGSRLPPEKPDLALETTLGAVVFIHFFVALMPEVGADALATHLFVPGHLATRHEWAFDPSMYVWAVMPMLGDWVFSIAYMLGGESATRTLNVLFILALALSIRSLVLWAGGGNRGAAVGAILFLSTPLVFTESSSLFIESVWTVFVIGGVVLVLQAAFDKTNDSRDLVLAGLLFGFAMAAKLITVTILPAAALALAVRARHNMANANTGRNLAIGVAAFLCAGSIPYVTAALSTGNPVFPFFNHIFASPLYLLVRFNNPHFNFPLSWNTLYDILFHSGKYLESGPGASGFHWLVFLPVAIALGVLLRSPRALFLAVIGLSAIAVTFHFQSYLRYILPSAVVLSGLLGWAFTQSEDLSAASRRLMTAALTVTVTCNLYFLPTGSFYKDFPVAAVFSSSSRADYLLGRQPIRLAVALVNELNATREPVAVFGPTMAAGLRADALYPNWYNYRFQSAVLQAKTPEEMAGVLYEHRSDYFILDVAWPNPAARALLEQMGETVAEFGQISVRSVRKEFRFGRERLRNPDFQAIEGWALGREARFDHEQRFVEVTGPSPATQVVEALPKHRYVYALTARCASSKTSGRLQINWVDASMKFIEASIRVFECDSDWTDHQMEVISPQNAAHAVVYATAHGPKEIQVRRVSLR